jgi:hypothetical protein
LMSGSESFILNDQSTPNEKCDFHWASFSMICNHRKCRHFRVPRGL